MTVCSDGGRPNPYRHTHRSEPNRTEPLAARAREGVNTRRGPSASKCRSISRLRTGFLLLM